MTLPTNLTRRALLGAGAAGAAALAGLRTAAPAAAAPGHLVRSSYAGLTGQRFTAGPVALRLLSVTDVAGAAADARLAGSQDAFALAFSGPLGQPLPAGIHTFRHPSLGAVQLFVSPVEAPRADRRYEVVVDRSVGVPKSVPQAPAAPAIAAPGRRARRRPAPRPPAAPDRRAPHRPRRPRLGRAPAGRRRRARARPARPPRPRRRRRDPRRARPPRRPALPRQAARGRPLHARADAGRRGGAAHRAPPPRAPAIAHTTRPGNRPMGISQAAGSATR